MKHYTMNRTGLVIFIGLLAYALYDLALVTFTGVGTSISNWLTNVAQISPVFTFTVGTIIGHLFFPMREKKKDP